MLITFITSLVLIVLLFSVKFFELSRNKKTSITQKIRQGDLPIKMFFLRKKRQLAYINWKNFILLTIFLSRIFHKKATLYKRRFDSRQPRFLIASTPEALNRNNSKKPSIFLREITSHKHGTGNPKK